MRCKKLNSMEVGACMQRMPQWNTILQKLSTRSIACRPNYTCHSPTCTAVTLLMSNANMQEFGAWSCTSYPPSTDDGADASHTTQSTYNTGTRWKLQIMAYPRCHSLTDDSEYRCFRTSWNSPPARSQDVTFTGKVGSVWSDCQYYISLKWPLAQCKPYNSCNNLSSHFHIEPSGNLYQTYVWTSNLLQSQIYSPEWLTIINFHCWHASWKLEKHTQHLENASYVYTSMQINICYLSSAKVDHESLTPSHLQPKLLV